MAGSGTPRAHSTRVGSSPTGRRSLLAGAARVAVAAVTAACLWSAPAWAEAPSREQVLDTMRRATSFMVEKVSTNGGYVWSYLPDFSRRWGELEAKPSMIWVQPPGTGTMGHLFLDAYHATGDEYYYQAAEKAAAALIWGQHPSGGWNYLIDFGGEASLKDWYATTGANAWRMEEFQHYYGNATFDDAGTAEASTFLLRLYVEKRDPKYRPALEKAISFVLDSQYPIGGWPQRFPLRHEFSHHGRPDYTSFITFNDDVAGENIKFLIFCYQVLGEQRALDAITRAMNSFLVTQQGQPQPGWALQYTPDLKPAGARSYEPLALATHTTAANLKLLMDFYQLTGETKFLARIPEALDWLDSVRLPAAQVRNNRAHPTFIEIGTNKPLFIHRRGSNVVNGEYYADGSLEKVVGHYSSVRALDVAGLRRRYEALKAMPVAEATRGSPLLATAAMELPRYFTLREMEVSDLNSSRDGRPGDEASPERVAQLLSALNAEGYWPTELRSTSNPYRGPGPAQPAPGDFATTHVGDASDTSPYPVERGVTGISTGTYIQNMGALIGYLAGRR
ncbi:MAG TPA: pectate lyase [Azospirillaceae bacterium]|nr:pectate lyase [Azospirillaceae bacterium]